MPYYFHPPPQSSHSWIIAPMDLLFLVMLQAALWTLADGVCTFPPELQGKWYQKGIGDMTIAPENITHKGHCVTSAGSFFLLENRGMGCYQCLELLPRHNNVLQYRESYCVERDGLENICGQIKHDDLLHTMVREPGAPMRCPFQDAYHFSYNNNTGGWCRNPTSYVKSCASDARLIFHLKHCPDAAYTYEIDLELVCLASWSDGSETYMFGKFNGPGITGKDNMYRCFMYQILGTVVYLAMSGDATCRGLRSPRDGPFVMEFTKDVFGWPQPQCQFPAWVSRYTWRDLSGRYLYMSNAEGGVVSVRYRYPDEHSDVQTTFRCLRVLQDDHGGEKEFIAMSFTSDECAIRYQCVMFIKRRDGVTEIHQGKYTEYDSEPCSLKDFDRRNARHLLFPAPTPVTSCPYPGLHRLVDTQPGCEGYIQSGCNGTSSMEIVDPCSPQPRVLLECLKTWGGKRRQFIVASRAGHIQDTANCFVMKIRDEGMQFSTDRNCNIGTSDIFRTAVKYSINQIAERCIMKQEKPKFRPEPDSRHNSERDTGADININNDAERDERGDEEAKDADLEQKDQERNVNPYRHLNKDAPQQQVAGDGASKQSTPFFVCDIMLFVTLLVVHMLIRS